MALKKEKAFKRNLVLFSPKIWVFLMLCKPDKGCCSTHGDFSKGDWLKFNEGNNYSQRAASLFKVNTAGPGKNTLTANDRSCWYFQSSNRLICNGSIDFVYLKTLQEKPINDFVVENYEVESVYKRKYWSGKTLTTGEWYINIPKTYQKLTGVIQLKDTGISISVVARMVPRKNSNGFFIDGEAFSNKIVKVSWKLKGELSLKLVKSRTVITLDVGTTSHDWRVESNLTFGRRNTDSDVDDWKFHGIIKSDYISENQFALYKGNIFTRMMKRECRFWGEINVLNVNLAAGVSGNVSPPQNKQITIPKSGFSNMTIKNFVFKDSNFFNDFDKNAFEGLKGMESIKFVDSKLEVMPRLDELFQNLTNLREIYIENCVTPSLKFGSLSKLRNLKKVSFQGSGPLLFDDTSFVWLKNSSLTHLSLKNSHVKISSKSKSILRSVNSTLKYLDVSCSTLTEENDLAAILGTLTITHLKAQGLKLRKIPTSALVSVRESLEYLSLRSNNFKKIIEKNMFDNIFNFPLMTRLRELNLMECHINYIEKGSFDNLPNLKILRLGYNKLENVPDGWMLTKPQVTHLDLRNNGLRSQVSTIVPYELGISMNFSAFQKLEVLDLSNGIFTNLVKLIRSLGNSVRQLSLSNSGLEDPPENIFRKLTRLEILDMSYNRNVRSLRSFSFNIFKHLKNLKSLRLKQCRISNSATFREDDNENKDSTNYTLNNLEFVDLSSNNIKMLDLETLKLFPKLKILNLSGNGISTWRTSLFSANKYLETVFLDENRIETISNDMMSDIRNLKHIKIGNNPFICGSYVYDILRIIHEFGNIQNCNGVLPSNEGFFSSASSPDTSPDDFDKEKYDFIKEMLYNFNENNDSYSTLSHNNIKFLDWSDFNYTCFSWSQSKFIPFSLVNESFQEISEKKNPFAENTLLWLPVVALAGVVISMGIICWKYLDVHLITRAVRNAVALSFLSQESKEPGKFEYNVFVSYSEKDRSWVVENLLPRLETWSDVKVCLHERDFQVGLSIMENIIASIDSSKNIILIVSQGFLKSQWCQYEMHLAQHRLLEKGRDQLILIFLESIPVIKRPKILRYLMMTKTYLEWPGYTKSGKEIDLFWNRLLKSLLKCN